MVADMSVRGPQLNIFFLIGVKDAVFGRIPNYFEFFLKIIHLDHSESIDMLSKND